MTWRSEQLDNRRDGQDLSYGGRVAHVGLSTGVMIDAAVVSPMVAKRTNGFGRASRGSPG